MLNERMKSHGWWAILAFLILVFPLSWYSWLLGFSADDPGNSGINPLGPLVAALLVSVAGGWRSFTAFWRNLVRVRSSWRTYAAALLLPIGLATAAVAITAALGAPFPADAALARWTDAIEPFLFAFLFVALGEEPGWRGFLLPRLQMRMTPLQAALAVAPIWALWHLPLFGKELPLDQLIPFLVSLTSASLVLTWLTNRTGGGVLPAMLCHATVNAVGAGFLFTFLSGPEKTTLWWINAGMWGLTSLLIVLKTRGRLGLTATGSAVPSAPHPDPSMASAGVAARTA